MKKIFVSVLLVGLLCTFLASCQTATRVFGGDMTIELEPNQKLEMITWKDSDLWYLTRPMRDDEEPETHTFEQSSNFGVLEGTVTVVESKTK